MAGVLSGDVSHHGTYQGSSQRHTPEKQEDGSRWYFARKEIEENSPSKKDGIDLKKETYLRKSYCTFLQDLGMRLKVPQVTIATAIIFCHRFFLRQSHAKNDRRTIATVCMFLAGKVEETPRPLKDVILVSYEIVHKKDPAAVQRIKQKEVYEQQKELILLGERVVLATLGFDLNVHHPYKPLVEAIKKFKVAQNALAQVAWNFVNDGLRTSLCLQFMPHHIAAGAIFLAAKFLKVKLPSDGEKVWWQEFDVTPRQLEEVSNQMLELYEQNRLPPSNDAEGAAGSGATNRPPAKGPTSNDETATTNSNSQTGPMSSKIETSKSAASKALPESSATNHVGRPLSNHNRGGDYGSSEMKHRAEDEAKHNQHPEWEHPVYRENSQEPADKSRSGYGEEQESNAGRSEMKESGEFKDKHTSRNLDHRDGTSGRPPQEAMKKIDRDKVKAALEKRRKASSQVTKKTEFMDDDDLIERELEDGIELASQNEKNKQDRRQSWSKSSDKSDHETMQHGRHHDNDDEHHHGMKGLSSYQSDLSNVEEGELSALDDIGPGLHSPKSNSRKRKAVSSPDRVVEGRQWHNYGHGSHHHNRFDYMDDRNKVGRLGHTERDGKRHIQENHV
ncbi:cyclin-T1-5 [Neltuma alba]|uniref:cyclin-T1-5 n=1 Tax=Neltuma alba TaxID=207710 RepID=UPI0010A3E260|nr:cyclin-T1-5-like [Prosopis alba]XP_028768716.1 cyclin-T1-5-like [Prosopis alba]XP_028768717.1 cyclin-T1-5-like [Prosopis alba]XP_028799565.1 cyclin-T1-5-like [Prosopis alba]XP_028799566.1 cyclin-T1-5-like [Prosopis alba]XP_028799567.1 cyclin-T1-5-like [Prosopis alba]